MKKIIEIIVWLLIIVWVIIQAFAFQSPYVERGDRLILLLIDIILFILVSTYYLQKDK